MVHLVLKDPDAQPASSRSLLHRSNQLAVERATDEAENAPAATLLSRQVDEFAAPTVDSKMLEYGVPLKWLRG